MTQDKFETARYLEFSIKQYRRALEQCNNDSCIIQANIFNRIVWTLNTKTHEESHFSPKETRELCDKIVEITKVFLEKRLAELEKEFEAL